MIRFVIGSLLIFGTVGNYDFYDECLAAADCVANAPDPYTNILMAVAGLGLMLWGVIGMNTSEEYQ